MAEPLTRRERDMLAFERHHIRGQGAREALASKLWPDLTPVRYAQLLFALARRPEADAVAPAVVRRLQRTASVRRRARRAAER